MCTTRTLCFSCDVGFGGVRCAPIDPVPQGMKVDFAMMSSLETNWLAILGGSVAGANQGCGTMLSGESLYFSKVMYGMHIGTRVYIPTSACRRGDQINL